MSHKLISLSLVAGIFIPNLILAKVEVIIQPGSINAINLGYPNHVDKFKN
jgi:hypothetical protein